MRHELQSVDRWRARCLGDGSITAECQADPGHQLPSDCGCDFADQAENGGDDEQHVVGYDQI